MPDEELTPTTETPSPPSGRAALISLYKQRNPELETDPEDEDLFNFAGRGYSERDEIHGKYQALNGANEQLAAVVAEDPRFAKFIGMIGAGENPMYALGSVFGNILDELDEQSLEQLRAGQEEFKANFNKVRENFSTYEQNLKAYGETNGIDPERLSNINNAILDIAEAFNARDISPDIIELVDKGLDYDNERAALSEAEALSIRNKTIDEQKSGAGKPMPMPDMQGSKKQANKPPMRRFDDEKPYVPYSERLETAKT